MRALLQKVAANLHYVGTVLLVMMAVPAARHVHLPVRVNWAHLLEFYWVSLGPRSVAYALLFCIVALPLRATISPFWARYRKQRLRWLFVLVFLLALTHVLWFSMALVLTIDALFVVELAERSRSSETSFRKKTISVLLSATYMFIGLTVVVIYNDLIVAGKFPVAYDALLNRIDTWIFFGRTVPMIAHRMFAILPHQWLSFLDFAYFQMFLIVGAALLIAAFASCERGLRFVGTCLTAYYLALLIFYCWPSYGPYVFCSSHATQLPPYLASYAFQVSGMPSLQAIMQRKSTYLGTGYYIAFPSMHVGLPVIAMWFMRHGRRVFWFLFGYSCVVACTLVILEWHYALDIPGGIAVAALAIRAVGSSSKSVR